MFLLFIFRQSVKFYLIIFQIDIVWKPSENLPRFLHLFWLFSLHLFVAKLNVVE